MSMFNWTDNETKQLLLIRAQDNIKKQINGTVRDSVIYDKIAETLRERGVKRKKAQVISKLKCMRKKYLQIVRSNDNSDWPYFDVCNQIWGSKSNPLEKAVTLLIHLDSESEVNQSDYKNGELDDNKDNCAVTTEELEVLIEDDNESATDTRPESPCEPREKRSKRTHGIQQIPHEMQKLFSEMDKEFHKKESLRIQEQRQYEEELRKEAKEEERKERVSQTAMWKEMLEAQNNLFKDLLQRLPMSTPLPPQSAECIQKHLAELDRDFHDKESLRTQEQRQYEEQLRKEAKEAEREEWSRQMTMWREMQESQNNLFKEILSRLPLPTPQQQSSFYTSVQQHQGPNMTFN